MEKTKLGIKVGVLGMLMYFSCIFSGYVVAILLAGYILLFEENAWLQKSAIKAIALMFCISFLVTVINLVPSIASSIDEIATIFEGSFNLGALTRILSAITSIIGIAEKVLFIVLGLKALKQEDVSIPVVDKLAE